MLKRASLSIAMILGTCFAGHVLAQENGLGSRWPKAADVSVSPNWHVYVFMRSGVKYIQVNDLNGTVREVVATAGDQILVLPMGVDTPHVSTSQKTVNVSKAAQCGPPDCGTVVSVANTAAQTNSQPQQVVYSDGLVRVTMKADGSGNPQWTNAVTADSCEPPECFHIITQPNATSVQAQ